MCLLISHLLAFYIKQVLFSMISLISKILKQYLGFDLLIRLRIPLHFREGTILYLVTLWKSLNFVQILLVFIKAVMVVAKLEILA